MRNFFKTVTTVLSAFVGIRRKADHEAAPIKIGHIIVTALILVVLIIVGLVTLVKKIAAHAG